MTLGGPTVPTSGRAGPAKVVIIEDHRVVAEALAAVFAAEGDLEVVGTAGTVDAGLALVRDLSPDVVVMDHQLPDGNGIDASARIRAERPGTAVVMLTGTGSEAVLARAVAAGCRGFVVKEEGVRQVVNVLRAVLAGEVCYSTGAHRSGRRPTAQAASLTSRELEVLALLADGASTATVRDCLGVSTHTVRNHVRHIIAKLNAHSKLEAVAIAKRESII